MIARNAIVVNYPNPIGDAGRYSLRDQRDFFSRFDGGASAVFGVALENVLDGDMLHFFEQIDNVFESYYQMRLDENTATMEMYQADKREFYRRTFDVYRFAKTSLKRLGENAGLSEVKRIAANCKFDSGSFLLK
jgi:hypothetical protein